MNESDDDDRSRDSNPTDDAADEPPTETLGDDPEPPRTAHGEAQAPSTDELFRLLSSAERRVVVRTLANASGATAFENLVDAVVQSTATDESVGTVRVDLLHVHLPRLQRMGLATFDRQAAVVESDLQASTVDGVQRNAHGVR